MFDTETCLAAFLSSIQLEYVQSIGKYKHSGTGGEKGVRRNEKDGGGLLTSCFSTSSPSTKPVQ